MTDYNRPKVICSHASVCGARCHHKHEHTQYSDIIKENYCKVPCGVFNGESRCVPVAVKESKQNEPR